MLLPGTSTMHFICIVTNEKAEQTSCRPRLQKTAVLLGPVASIQEVSRGEREACAHYQLCRPV
ncbi:rCG62220 [Rattus norvegicus]|uniref:RCG62220 n=1 Tax=Rattus norvegicus TaxID=10116 RepID=A6HAX8_RAT|nr:rCG62220 [Rattus norvegicus]